MVRFAQGLKIVNIPLQFDVAPMGNAMMHGLRLLGAPFRKAQLAKRVCVKELAGEFLPCP
jgi:hypothetical protein